MAPLCQPLAFAVLLTHVSDVAFLLVVSLFVLYCLLAVLWLVSSYSYRCLVTAKQKCWVFFVGEESLRSFKET